VEIEMVELERVDNKGLELKRVEQELIYYYV